MNHIVNAFKNLPRRGTAQLREDIVLVARIGYQFGDYRRNLLRADIRYLFQGMG